MSFNNLSISTRMAAGFIAVLVILTGMAAAGLHGITQADSAVDDIRNSARIALAAKQVERDFVVLRRALREFTLSADGAARDNAAQAQSATAQSVAVLTHLAPADKRLIDMKAAFAAYGEGMAQLIDEIEHSGVDSARSHAWTDKMVSQGEAAMSLAAQMGGHAQAQAEAGADVVEQNVHNTLNRIVFGAIFAVIAGIVISSALTRSIVRPLKLMTHSMNELAQGNLFVDIPAWTRRDEIGAMSQAMGIFKQNALGLDKMRQDQEAAKLQAAAERAQALRDMAHAFENRVSGVVTQVYAAADGLRNAAQNMNYDAEQAGSHAQNVAESSEKASAGVQNVATATEELAASIREIARQTSLSVNAGRSAVAEVETAAHDADELAHAAQQIGQVVTLINEIAGQTNLLALNATIEAARAGDAGKGFAVVAGEVKSLANQTSRATAEITAKIEKMRSVAQSVVGSIGGIGRAIRDLDEVSQSIAAAIEEQEAATAEIAGSLEVVAGSTQMVSAGIGHVSQAAGSTAGAAGSVLVAANDLNAHSETLDAAVADFLSTVRAA